MFTSRTVRINHLINHIKQIMYLIIINWNKLCLWLPENQVDWTPELHRKFVQAVEQLGVDKAVPSRILEIMDVKSLTRHNVASHLQVF